MLDLSPVKFSETHDLNKELEMSYHPLTPPSSSEESPQSYNILSSPQPFFVGSPSAHNYPAVPYVISTNQQYAMDVPVQMADQKYPYLSIVEQPADKFRFRYKSEMAGTHGSLTGINSDKTRKQTSPTVKLNNYFGGECIIRCSLYQFGSDDDRQPHAHRLIKKHGNDECDDPHNMKITQQDGYVASFQGMGIIHTAKKHIVDELKRKKELLKTEDITRTEGHKRKLNKREEVEIASQANKEQTSINLNIVCLRFDAFETTHNGAYMPICLPIYSHAINNLKSALTGELKIVRMDHSSSSSKGNREIFMLVEKVTKKNIKVRFFELDDEDIEVWSDYGRFSDLDVHHQYAIVFRTPPFRELEIDQQKTVYIELLRPSDGSRSESREFTYYPHTSYKPGSKRPRSFGYSSGSGSWSNSMNSGEVPVPVLNMEENSDLQVSSADLDIALQNVDSEEFKNILLDFNHMMKNDEKQLFPDVLQYPSIQTDAPGMDRRGSNEISSHKDVTNKDLELTKRTYTELDALLKTKPSKKTVIGMLDHLLQKYVNSSGNNALHLSILAEDWHCLLYLFKIISYLKQHHLLNLVNARNETITHVAIRCHNFRMVELILKYKPDLSIQGDNGNTVLHMAIMENCSRDMLAMILNCGVKLQLNVDAKNNDDHTALHMAVKINNLAYVELLCAYGASVDDFDKKTGRSVLHVAVAEQAKSIVIFLLKNTKVDVQLKDYGGSNALKLAYCMNNNDIYRLIEEDFKSKGLHSDCIVKDEEEDEDSEEMECDDIELKTEKLSPDELNALYQNVKMFTPVCLDQVSEILDESGNWECLADLLDLGHLLHTDWFIKAKSPSKALLTSAVSLGDVLHIRNFLENLEELKAVSIIDKMVQAKN